MKNNIKKEDNNLAILSLVFSFLFAPVGLTLGIMALIQKQSKALAISGIVISALGMLFTFMIMVAAIISAPSTNPSQQTAQTQISNSGSSSEKKSYQTYEYEWEYIDALKTHNVLLKDFNNTDSDFKERIKATITDLQNKTSLGEDTLINLTDSRVVYDFERQSNPASYVQSVGGKDVFNKESSLHTIALYSKGSFSQDGECSSSGELMFYPDVSNETYPDQARYKETACWSPLKTQESLKRDIEAKQKEEEQRKAEEARLPSGDDTTSLCIERFDQTYPYKGSKVHSILGVISLDKSSDNSRLYKVEVTIANAYGAEYKATMECNVVKSNDGAISIERFDIY